MSLSVPSWIMSPSCREMLSIPVGRRTPAQSVNAWVEEWQTKARDWEKFGELYPGSATFAEERVRFCMDQADQVIRDGQDGKWGRGIMVTRQVESGKVTLIQETV